MGLVAVDAEERFEPERIVDALNRGGVRYVIVGGLAAGTHGVVRATRDLDLVPDPERSNMDRLARVLSDLGGQHPVTDQLTAAGIARPVSLKVLTQAGEVHVLNRVPGTPTRTTTRRGLTPRSRRGSCVRRASRLRSVRCLTFGG